MAADAWDQKRARGSDGAEARAAPAARRGSARPVAEGRGARAAVGGDRATGRSRGEAFDGQTSGPTVTSRMEPQGQSAAVVRKGEREQDRGSRQNLLHR